MLKPSRRDAEPAEPTAGAAPLDDELRQRLLVYPWIFVALYVLLGGWWLISGDGLLDRSGKNVGVDFVTFWAASEVSHAGQPALVWDVFQMAPRQDAAIGAPVEAYAFHYPPIFLLLCWPLALVPYLPSLLGWWALGTAAFVAWARRAVPHRLTLGLALAFPGFFQNILQGQNGLFTASLLGGALWSLRERPALAGFLLGVLSFKPHLAAAAFLVLLLTAEWVALGAALLTAAALAAGSLAAFGPEPWSAFLHNTDFALTVLETPDVLPWERMPTVHVASMLLGASPEVARALQGASAALALLVLVRVWTRTGDFTARVAALVATIFLSTPFAFDYDCALLALPAAALGWELLQGRRGHERLLIALYLSPLAVPAVAAATHIQLGPALSVWLLALAWRRAEAGPPRPRPGTPQGVVVPQG